MTTIPSEIISQIMLFHSNIRFDKNELVKFITEWKIVKEIQEDNWDTGQDGGFDKLNEIIDSNILVRRFYYKYVGCEYQPPEESD